MYVYSGSCMNIVDGVSVMLTEGELCVMSPGVYHLPAASDDSVIVVFIVRRRAPGNFRLMEGSAAAEYVRAVEYGAEYPKYMRVKTDAELKRLCDLLVCEELEPADGGYTSLRLLELIFIYLSRDKNVELSGTFRPGAPAVAGMLQYIYDNYTSVTLSALAESFHYSEEHVCRMLKASTGRTFTELLRGIRVTRAERLLTSTALPAEEIAARSGYGCVKHFYRSFRAETGTTPGRYRESLGK